MINRSTDMNVAAEPVTHRLPSFEHPTSTSSLAVVTYLCGQIDSFPTCCVCLRAQLHETTKSDSPCYRRPHGEADMAPHVGFDTEQIRDKARKDLLYLLSGVSLLNCNTASVKAYSS